MGGCCITGCNGIYGKYTLAYFLDAQVRLGFHRLDLYNLPAHLWLTHNGSVGLERLRGELDRRGLTVAALHPLPAQYSLCPEPGSLREMCSKQYFRGCVDAAAKLSAPLLCLRPAGELRDRDDVEQRRAMVRFLEELTGYASVWGVQVLIQTAGPEESRLLCRLDQMEGLLEQTPGLDVLLDSVVLSNAGETIGDWFRRLGPRIRRVRLMDGRNDGGRIWGEGCFPGHAYAQALLDAGYTGDILPSGRLERYQQEPEAADQKNLERLRAYLNGGEGSAWG